nr:hypothetical protein [Rhizobium sp. G21]
MSVFYDGAHIHARQQKMIRVGKYGPNGHRAGRFADRSLCELQFSLQLVARSVLERQANRGFVGVLQLAAANGLPPTEQVLARLADFDINRIQLADRRQSRRLSRCHQGAGIDGGSVGPAIDRRAYFGVAEIDAGGFDRRFCGAHIRFGLRQGQKRVFIILAGDRSLVVEALQPLGFGRSIAFSGLGPRQGRFCARERRLICVGINPVEKIACLDVGTLGELALDNKAGDLRSDFSGVECSNAPSEF